MATKKQEAGVGLRRIESLDQSKWESFEDKDEEEALESLQKLAPSGVLKIITNAHVCQGKDGALHPDMAKDRRAFEDKCERYEFPLTSVRHFQLHTVTGIYPYAGKEGTWAALSEEGDYTIGKPRALLNRLLEHQRE